MLSALPDGLRLFLELAAKGLLALAAAGAVNAALPRLSAAKRHLVWLLALLSLIAVPALALLAPTWRVAVLPKATAPPQQSGQQELTENAGTEARPPSATLVHPSPAHDSPGVGTIEAEPVASVPAHSAPPSGAGRSAVRSVPRAVAEPVSPTLQRAVDPHTLWTCAVWAWAFGAACAWSGPLIGILATARLGRAARRRSRASPCGTNLSQLLAEVMREMGVRHPVALALSGPGAVPMALGLTRPMLLLPDEAATWPQRRLRAVLRHELAHVLRRDCLTQLLARLACGLHWFNPLAWFALRQLRTLQERACDDRVLACGAKASDYAEDLVAVARSVRVRSDRSLWSRWREAAILTGGSSMSRGGRSPALRSRVHAILDPRTSRRPTGAAALILGAAAVLAVPPLAVLRVSHAAPPASSSTSPAAPTTLPAAVGPSTVPVNPSTIPPIDATFGNAGYVARLRAGGALELVAVGTVPPDAAAWWAPAGSPLVPAFATTIPAQPAPTRSNRVPVPDSVLNLKPTDSSALGPLHEPHAFSSSGRAFIRQFVVRVRGGLPGASRALWRPVGSAIFWSGTAAAAPGADAVGGNAWDAAAALFPVGSRQVEFEVGIAAGPWETLAENPADQPGIRSTGVETGAERSDKRLRELEVLLGGRDGTVPDFVAKREYMRRLIEERFRIMKEIEGFRARLDSLTHDLSEGRTPPAIDAAIRNTRTYSDLRSKLTDLDVRLERAEKEKGPRDPGVSALRQERTAVQSKADEEYAQLQTTLSQGRKAEYESELNASKDNLNRIEKLIEVTSQEVVSQHALVSEYQDLSRRQHEVTWRKQGASFAKGVESDGNTTVSVAHGVIDPDLWEVRVSAVGADGSEVSPTHCESRNAAEIGQTTARFDKVPLGRVKRFRIQVRPYEWVRFKNVCVEAPADEAPPAARPASRGRRPGSPE